MSTRQTLTAAVLFGLSGGAIWAGIPPALTMPAEERQRVEASVFYSGCNEVRALGKAPLRMGEPGYRPEMDGDQDGIACEPHIR
ncbi:excalibur calcium-binding domain-containing protein [Sphingomonas mesophila]|uniref:excalibur calcium-binding domain-containing protein n=1 Tax=Sphingomonas mesophila TaxID=2303576 RepID=UPI000E569AD1|nr:excalibur calcium-binding domain-containing protein [Sphingomonas mesophila]